jgi:hypothetical protein
MSSCLSIFMCTIAFAGDPPKGQERDTGGVEAQLVPVILGCNADNPAFGTMKITIDKKSSSILYSCYPYRCDSSTRTCASSCDANGDCAPGGDCVSGECMPHLNGVSQACSSGLACPKGYNCLNGRCEVIAIACVGGFSDYHVSGASKDASCSPYRCNPSTATCETTCSDTSDCLDGTICMPDHRCRKP